MSRVPPTLPSSTAAVSSPRLSSSANGGPFSTASPGGSPRHSLALPGHMSPYRDSSARFSLSGLTSLNSPRSSVLARDATSSTHYPTSASRPSSPTQEDRDKDNPPDSAGPGDSRTSYSRSKPSLPGKLREGGQPAESSRPSSPINEQELDAARGESFRCSVHRPVSRFPHHFLTLFLLSLSARSRTRHQRRRAKVRVSVQTRKSPT